MKNDKIRRMLPAFVLLFSMLVLLCSCAASPPDYFAYRERAASAELEGSLYVSPFCARLSFSTGAEGYGVELEYLRHPTLAGLCLVARFDESGSPIGEAQVCFSGLSYRTEGEALEGLLLPAEALLREGDLQSVTREGDGYRLVPREGEVLTLGADGTPIGFRSDAVDFWIVWWENT